MFLFKFSFDDILYIYFLCSESCKLSQNPKISTLLAEIMTIRTFFGLPWEYGRHTVYLGKVLLIVK